MAKKGKAIGGIWYPDALAENDIEDFNTYQQEVMRLASKMGNLKGGVCLDTVRDSFNRKVPVGEAAKTACFDTQYWEHGI